MARPQTTPRNTHAFCWHGGTYKACSVPSRQQGMIRKVGVHALQSFWSARQLWLLRNGTEHSGCVDLSEIGVARVHDGAVLVTAEPESLRIREH